MANEFMIKNNCLNLKPVIAQPRKRITGVNIRAETLWERIKRTQPKTKKIDDFSAKHVKIFENIHLEGGRLIPMFIGRSHDSFEVKESLNPPPSEESIRTPRRCL